MIKKEKGITLVSLIITIVLMTIIASTVIYISMDRFEINNLRKMFNDIELLQDKVSNYYLKYDALPILRNDSNTPIHYTYTTLDFEKNSADNENYYILDLKAMEGISLNYGKEGFEEPNASDDVYIINQQSHTIYYVKGMVLKGVEHHTLTNTNGSINDNIPPSSPKINVISGEQYIGQKYLSDIELEFVPGIEKMSDIEKTTYSINGGTETDITTLENNIYPITDVGTYEIILKTYDIKGNYSQLTTTFRKVKLITFTVEETTYQAEEGMTWAEWCESEYNLGGWYIGTDKFGTQCVKKEEEKDLVLYEDWTYQEDDTVIIDGKEYRFDYSQPF